MPDLGRAARLTMVAGLSCQRLWLFHKCSIVSMALETLAAACPIGWGRGDRRCCPLLLLQRVIWSTSYSTPSNANCPIQLRSTKLCHRRGGLSSIEPGYQFKPAYSHSDTAAHNFPTSPRDQSTMTWVKNTHGPTLCSTAMAHQFPAFVAIPIYWKGYVPSLGSMGLQKR